MNKLRLKWKIFIFLLGFCALLLVMLWLLQTVFLDTFYKNIRVSEIKRDAGLIADSVWSEDLSEIIADISQNSEIIVDITGFDGCSLLTPFDLPQNRRIADENSILILLARDNGSEFYEYIDQFTDRPENMRMPGNRPPMRPMQSLVYVKLAGSEEGGQFAVIIRAVISPVNATVTTLRYQLYVVSGIMLALSAVLAIFIAKHVSRPIEEISKGALSLAKGNYDTKFIGKGFHEIVTLSDTLSAAATELGRVEGLRRELLANVSHDLRTPLSLIYSYAEMMRDFPNEITPEQMQVIMEETTRLSGLVDDILEISKLESDMGSLDVSHFNLTRCISETVSRMGALLENDGFKITFSHDADIYVDADETKINRAFYNLLINAVNYSGGSRDIYVKQTVMGGSVRISVKDNGEGITEAELPDIWNRYYKSGKEHKRGVTGIGLGLSIVKKVIEAHGGKYGVMSEAGKGSVFWFEIETANSY